MTAQRQFAVFTSIRSIQPRRWPLGLVDMVLAGAVKTFPDQVGSLDGSLSPTGAHPVPYHVLVSK